MDDLKVSLGEEEKVRIESENIDGRYKTLFEQVNAAAFLSTFEGQILEANHKSCDLFGYSWNEILRLSLKDILSNDTDWDQFKDEIAAKGGLNVETESITKDGSYFPVEISISLFRMDKKPAIFVLIWDITDRKKAENKLRESEKKYRGLFEYTTDGTLVLDARGDILDVNTKICEMLDFTKDSFIGKNLFNMEILTAKSQPVVVNQFEQLLSEKTANSYTTEIKNNQSQILNVEVSSFFLVRKDNEVDNFVLIIRDITSRNLIEQTRRKEHGLLKTLLDNIPDSIYFKDEENRFILVNQTKASHYNIPKENMIGKTDFDFLPEDQAKIVYDDDLNIIKTGNPIINKEEKVTHINGSEKWVSVTKIPRFNPEGEIIGTMGISRDITNRKEIELELERNQHYLKTLMNNIHDAVSFKDQENKYVLINKSKAKLMNIKEGNVIGKTDFDFFSHDQAQIFFDEDSKVFQTGEPIVDKILIIPDENGVEHWFSVNKRIWFDNNNEKIGTIEMSSDITKWRKIEETNKDKIK